ncbi:MAG: LysM peptidoglycan-binding domain-containing protein [Elusimicrobiota bacterium]|nr:MAG: LysM peptidoglycan-binding domain-containing protein [Elusimicrobiota bacterium]
MRLAAGLLVLLLGGAAPARAQEDASAFQAVVVKPGDTLWAIANKYLKDPSKWDEIIKHNRLPTKDPTIALPGMTLRVPVRLIKSQLRAAHLVYAVNRVLYRRKETADWKSGKLEMELFQGDSVRTLEESKARVKLLDRELLSLEQNSMAVIKPAGRDGDLELKSGSVFAGRARVVTATASVTPRSRDTRYAASVEPDLTTRVEVYKGMAAVDAQGISVDVPAGMGTRVQPGLAPEVPKAIADLPELENRAFEYASAVKVGGGAAPEPRGPAAAPPAPEADADSLRGDLQSLRVGLPIMGYRIQAAEDRDFAKIVFEKKYEPEDRLRPGEEGLKPGAYWWRIAIIDLLGTEGRFSEPRYYTVGVKRAPSAVTLDLKKAVTIAYPAEDATIDADTVKVSGVLRDDRLSVEVNGKKTRADADGNFLVTVPVKEGMNEIVITVLDGKGNSTDISRRVHRR